MTLNCFLTVVFLLLLLRMSVGLLGASGYRLQLCARFKYFTFSHIFTLHVCVFVSPQKASNTAFSRVEGLLQT